MASDVKTDNQPYDDINVTPMLDLAYVLLVIFIILTTASVQGVRVDSPTARAAENLSRPQTRAVTITADGAVFLDAYPVTLEQLQDQLGRYKAANPALPVVLKGDARDRDLLEEANAPSAHAIVTVTNDDEVNIMAALLAKRMGCRRALALVNNTAYEGLVQSLGIDVAINPRDTTVSSVLQHVRRGRIKAAHTLREIRTPGLIVGAVGRDRKLISPRGDTEIRARDRLVVAARADSIRKVEQLFAVRLDYF